MTSESGQSTVETVLVGLLVFVPIIWLVAVMSELHRAALGTTSAAREAGFEAARSSDIPSAERAAADALARAIADHGLASARARLEWSLPEGLRRGGRVEVEVSYDVPVLSFPFLGEVSSPAVQVQASHSARIDPYRSRP